MPYRLILLLGLLNSFVFYSWSQTPDTCVRVVGQHIVVIGSSTAAGVGPTTLDSAWVWRYRSSVEMLHPDYQVTNLAKGGYQTYHLMPNDFIPPSGSPWPDTLRNITKALSLDPDAIIINLPSNDASAGVDAATQMQNFRMMVDQAADKEVPVWICTPQPRVFNSAKVAIQLALLDSVSLGFAGRNLDFWTGFADANGQPISTYDSGDGIHLNDEGHRILFERVANANIPQQALQIDSVPHYVLHLVDTDWFCAISSDQLRLRWINLGSDESVQLFVRWQHPDTTFIQQFPLQHAACEGDDQYIDYRLPFGGEWLIQTFVLDDQGSPASDTLEFSETLFSIEPPAMVLDTACFKEPISLIANGSGNISWWADDSSDNILSTDSILNLSTPSQNHAYWVSQEKGPLRRDQKVRTVDRFDRDWNGVMVDLTAYDDLVLDSIEVPISSPGTQTMVIWYHPGTHIGFEQLPGNWLIWDSVTVTVDSSWTWIPITPFSLTEGDTIALYLQLANAGSRLRYDATQEPEWFTSRELGIFTGTGVSYTFGDTYYPRIANLTFGYHFERGYCPSKRVSYPLVVNQPSLDLAPDTLVSMGDTLYLTAPMGYEYSWSNGAQSQETFFLKPDWSDSLLIRLEVTDVAGCTAADSIWAVWIKTKVQEPALEKISLNQDRLRGTFWLEGTGQPPTKIQLLDMRGQFIKSWPGGNWRQPYFLPNLPRGLYLVKVTVGNRTEAFTLRP